MFGGDVWTYYTPLVFHQYLPRYLHKHFIGTLYFIIYLGVGKLLFTYHYKHLILQNASDPVCFHRSLSRVWSYW
jgi:hypothetical protein